MSVYLEMGSAISFMWIGTNFFFTGQHFCGWFSTIRWAWPETHRRSGPRLNHPFME